VPHQYLFAADLADPKLIKEMETGHKLQLEVVDSSVLTVTTVLPVNQFAAIGKELRCKRTRKISMNDA
jgi:hypothetical protein